MESQISSFIIAALCVIAVAIFFLLRWLQLRVAHIRQLLQTNDLLIGITHEILTPLTILGASVEKLRQQFPDAESEYSLMDLNIQRSVRLLEQIIESNKLQTFHSKLKVSQGDIMLYIKEVAHSLSPLIDSKHIALSIRCNPESMMGWFDTDKIDKIIFNLLSNAVSHIGEGRQIDIDVNTNRQYSHIIIRISDNGPGLAFKTTYNLSIVQDLVYLHGGTIQNRSIEGQGTTYLIELPISKESFLPGQIDESRQVITPPQMILDSSVKVPQQLSAPPEAPSASAYHVLIVEGNEQLLTLMKQLMQGRYHIVTATNGREALEVVHAQPLHLIVADIAIPEINGYELTSIVKQEADYAHLPIILLTANHQEEDQIEALTAGADAVMTKPFKLRDLQLRIDNLITNRLRIHGDIATPVNGQTENVATSHEVSAEQEYLQRAIKCVNEHINDSDYDREAFAADMSSSVSTLYNKIRAATGQNVTSFIREIRIKRACQMAKANPDLRVSDIAYSVGFRDPKYFATSFKRVMGMQPKEYFEHLRTHQDE